ncbi:sialate O-acetylesterase [Labilibacter marinus]|uniref:sialate O-acetylesterase n=1 Tax=Labilibacter marinus TaxID=1477105 RepID=UPI000835B912|nr:sialate O-acetylesterase [Labilibacter marinus]
MSVLKRIIFSVLLTGLGLSSISAELSLPNIFGDHMVLQRNQINTIWGTAEKGEKITVSIADQKHFTKADKEGKWVIKLNPMKAGGPHSLVIEGKSKITYSDILVGEVWLCTGQSNMAMTLKGGPGQHIEGSQEAILGSNNKQLRFFTVATKTTPVPQVNCEGAWQLSKPKTAVDFSAVAYFFGKQIQDYVGVPVGLISCNQGATPAQAWTPKEIIQTTFPEFKDEWSKEFNNRTASGLYNGMLHPLIPFGIKGAIWYQGEGNRWDAEQYSRLFPAMIKSWRTNWQQGDFPFYFVQLAPYGKQGENWVKLQQSQLKTMLTVNNTGMAVINDIGDFKRIHPARKKEVGQRLALWALANDYRVEGISYSGPVYKSMEIQGNKALLKFDYAPLGLSTMGKELKYFEMAGVDNVYHPAEAKIIEKGSVLQVTCKQVSQPVSVRYGWESYIEGCLYNTAGVPASAFSTEDWENILKKQSN